MFELTIMLLFIAILSTLFVIGDLITFMIKPHSLDTHVDKDFNTRKDYVHGLLYK